MPNNYCLCDANSIPDFALMILSDTLLILAKKIVFLQESNLMQSKLIRLKFWQA